MPLDRFDVISRAVARKTLSDRASRIGDLHTSIGGAISKKGFDHMKKLVKQFSEPEI